MQENENKEQPTVDEGDMVDYIFTRLIEEGNVVQREDIQKILDLEFAYLVEQGLVEFVDEEETK